MYTLFPPSFPPFLPLSPSLLPSPLPHSIMTAASIEADNECINSQTVRKASGTRNIPNRTQPYRLHNVKM